MAFTKELAFLLAKQRAWRTEDLIMPILGSGFSCKNFKLAVALATNQDATCSPAPPDAPEH